HTEIHLQKRRAATAAPEQLTAKQFANSAAQFDETASSGQRHISELLEQGAHGKDKLEHLGEALPCIGIRCALAGFRYALAKHGHRRVDFPPLALFEYRAEHLPQVLARFEMLPAVAKHGNGPHDPPTLQLLKAGPDVPSC